MFCKANFYASTFPKALIFIQIGPKLIIFAKKYKIFDRWELRPQTPKSPQCRFLATRLSLIMFLHNFWATRILPNIGIAKGGPGSRPPPPNRNVSNNKLVRKRSL